MSTTEKKARGAGLAVAGKFDDRGHYLPIAYQLRLYRDQAGLDQRALARATEAVAAREIKDAAREGRDPKWTKGLTSYTINRYESGFHSPVSKNVALLARTLSEAISRAQGHRVTVTPADLRVRDAPGLAYYLRHVQGAESDDAFWGTLGIPVDRAQALLAGQARWTADELGAVAIRFPEAANAARDVMIDQARARRKLPPYRAWARRDQGHPDYVPPEERRGRGDAQIAPA